MFVPLNKNPVAALIVPVTERFPVVPVSVNVNKVLGEPAVSLIVKTPFALPVPSVTTGFELVRASGEAPDSVTVLLAAIVVAPDIAPAAVIPPLLLLIEPVIEAPPAATVSRPADVIVPVPVVVTLPEVEISPSSLIVSELTPPDLICRAVLVAPFVSSIINDGAVPALVTVNEVAVPEFEDSSYKVTATFRPVVVVIVLPASYASCKVTPFAFAAHCDN